MKSAAGSLLFLLVLGVTPLFAQQPVEEERMPVLSMSGERSWGVDVAGRAVGWKLKRPLHGATITARLGNGGGYAYLQAYLMRAIGPDVSEGDQVAETSFELPYPFAGWVDVFTDLELEPGEYWLVVGKPEEKAHSSINWIVLSPMALWQACDVEYLGTKSFTFMSDAEEYLPASKFEKKFEPYGFGIQVTSGPPIEEDPKVPAPCTNVEPAPAAQPGRRF